MVYIWRDQDRSAPDRLNRKVANQEELIEAMKRYSSTTITPSLLFPSPLSLSLPILSLTGSNMIFSLPPRVRKAEVEVIKLETLSPIEQLKIIENAAIMVGPHGAGWLSICKPLFLFFKNLLLIFSCLTDSLFSLRPR